MKWWKHGNFWQVKSLLWCFKKCRESGFSSGKLSCAGSWVTHRVGSGRAHSLGWRDFFTAGKRTEDAVLHPTSGSLASRPRGAPSVWLLWAMRVTDSWPASRAQGHPPFHHHFRRPVPVRSPWNVGLIFSEATSAPHPAKCPVWVRKSISCYVPSASCVSGKSVCLVSKANAW